MSSYSRLSCLFLCLLFFSAGIALADDAKSLTTGELTASDELYRAGKFPEAEARYEGLLKAAPQLVPAQVGLVRAMLKQQKIDESWEAVNKALSATPSAAPLLAVKGDVQFRRGDMAGAEISYLQAQKIDPKEVFSYLGLADLYRSYSLYRKAYDELQVAHRIAPDNIDVQRAYLSVLTRKQRLAAMEAYLAGPHPDDEEETKSMMEYVQFLKATINKPIHACKLVSKVEHTEAKLETILADDIRYMRGIGLSVKLNNRSARLLLDTGAGGIIVSQKVAEKAGLTLISSTHYAGIGDKGLQGGHTAVADHVRIGELEFQDCVVRVTDKGSALDEGLIGADVFGSYLVDLDLPEMRLKLSPLPKRPEDTTASTSLNSEGEKEQPAEAEEEKSAAGKGSEGQKASTFAPQLPKDRYVAPEMANWTKVFRFGHGMLVPTIVNDSKPMLFLLDTGAFSNILSTRAGRAVSKLSSEDRIRVRGMNGEVKKVYSSEKATIRFGHLQQPNLAITTLDLSGISRRMGTEVSGLLGFGMLRLLDVKLDYRDGLVEFKYDPNLVPNVR